MSGAARNALRAGTVLVVFAVVGTAMLAFTHGRTEPVITRSQQAEKLAFIEQVLPSRLYNNDLLASERRVARDDLLGTRRTSAAWVARQNDVFSGVVLEAVAPDGYSGDISLLIGIDAAGVLTGVRVTAHRETPGLGDYIDRAKSPWIEQFVSKSLDAPPPKGWKVAKDGGVFDARAGATITPRAVVKAVRGALEYFAQHRKAFATPPPAEEKDA